MSEVVAQFLEVVLAQDLRLLSIRTVGHLEDDFNVFAICSPVQSVRPPFASIAAKLQNCMYGDFQPMALGNARGPFSHPDWLFELKYDGFRALAHIDGRRPQLVSRNGHPFASFPDLGHAIADALPSQRAVLDGEIVFPGN